MLLLSVSARNPAPDYTNGVFVRGETASGAQGVPRNPCLSGEPSGLGTVARKSSVILPGSATLPTGDPVVVLPFPWHFPSGMVRIGVAIAEITSLVLPSPPGLLC